MPGWKSRLPEYRGSNFGRGVAARSKSPARDFSFPQNGSETLAPNSPPAPSGIKASSNDKILPPLSEPGAKRTRRLPGDALENNAHVFHMDKAGFRGNFL